ncbi:hypothetical protein [Lishizhenia tianjinensis]|uniref:hypothetical protein n=1 Tax=Lishizhenia tianjinensis TaxID=477690 RepID=UPI000B7D09DF|nr:hypothetical protein [Lishizhenia tianjinensis]
MTKYDFSALCTSRKNDNVLFSIHSSKNVDFDFALVYLTWKQKQKVGNFLKSDFYKDFGDFKYNKMIPDKIEWEE